MLILKNLSFPAEKEVLALKILRIAVRSFIVLLG
jgi:hypothetical protein